MPENERKAALLPGNKARVQGVTAPQTVSNEAGTLYLVVLANADAATQTLTVADGATTLVVLRQAAGTAQTYTFDAPIATSLVVTPSSINLDALVVFD